MSTFVAEWRTDLGRAEAIRRGVGRGGRGHVRKRWRQSYLLSDGTGPAIARTTVWEADAHWSDWRASQGRRNSDQRCVPGRLSRPGERPPRECFNQNLPAELHGNCSLCRGRYRQIPGDRVRAARRGSLVRVAPAVSVISGRDTVRRETGSACKYRDSRDMQICLRVEATPGWNLSRGGV